MTDGTTRWKKSGTNHHSFILVRIPRTKGNLVPMDISVDARYHNVGNDHLFINANTYSNGIAILISPLVTRVIFLRRAIAPGLYTSSCVVMCKA